MKQNCLSQCISSMQNQQTQNKNISPSSFHKQKNYQILKCKGKPFWLNLSQNKNINYQKYKNHLNPQSSYIVNQSQEITTANQYPLPASENQSYLESLQSFNQNYDEDFQSYKQTIKQQTQQKMASQSTHKKLASKKKFDIKLLLLESKIFKTPKRKVNFSSLSKINTAKITKTKVQNNIKTQESIRSQSVDLQKEIYMNENSKYLQQQNQKMLSLIKQMRSLLPMLNKNHQEIKQQKWQINSLKQQVEKVTSAHYGFELQKSKSFIQQNKKNIERNIKVLNSPKKVLHVSLTFRDDNNQNILSKEQKVREQLLCKLRLFNLRQEKSLQLDKKVNLYEKIIEKISTKQKINSFSSLQRRKTFLSWDIQRMKNQFDLRVLEENLQIDSLKQQIGLMEREIRQKQKNSFNLQQNYRIKNDESLIYKANQQQKAKDNNFSILESSFTKRSQKQINTRHQNQSSRLQTKKLPSNQKTIFYNKKQKQKLILSLNQKSLPEIHQNKNPNTPKIQTSTSRNQKQIRIKKFAFKNANLNEDLEQLIL